MRVFQLALLTFIGNIAVRAWFIVPNVVAYQSAKKTPAASPVFLSQSGESSAAQGESLTLVLTDEEILAVENIVGMVTEQRPLRTLLIETMQSLPPSLLIKLRQAEGHSNDAVRKVAKSFNEILGETLDRAKDTLKEFLDAGEVRKLDSLIGKASNEGRLDPAFFNVMSVNIKDAKQEEQEIEEEGASRVQVLQHIYTRCQEEVEKDLDPGIALFNKLLRTSQEQIRLNLYRHYLTPQNRTIETPDGKSLELKNERGSTLVSILQFVQAIETAVVQIRTLEKSGGTDEESAAIMVESCRSVAKEARVVIGESFGVESDELKEFETGLQPVFRPSSADSPYIQGQ